MALETGSGGDKRPSGFDPLLDVPALRDRGRASWFSKLSVALPLPCESRNRLQTHNGATLCLISQVHLCLKQVVLVQRASPYLHGGCGQRAEFASLISILSLLPGKPGKQWERSVPVRNAGMPICPACL